MQQKQCVPLIRNRCCSKCLFLTVVLILLVSYYYFLLCSRDYEDFTKNDGISVRVESESAHDGEVLRERTATNLENFDRHLRAMRAMGQGWTTLERYSFYEIESTICGERNKITLPVSQAEGTHRSGQESNSKQNDGREKEN